MYFKEALTKLIEGKKVRSYYQTYKKVDDIAGVLYSEVCKGWELVEEPEWADVEDFKEAMKRLITDCLEIRSLDCDGEVIGLYQDVEDLSELLESEIDAAQWQVKLSGDEG